MLKLENVIQKLDSGKIKEVLDTLESIDEEKESGKITQEEHDVRSKNVLESLEVQHIKSPMMKYMKTTVGKKRVVMHRSDGISQHYWMLPADIEKYKAKGIQVEVVGEEAEDKYVAVDFDGTIVTKENPDVLQGGAKEGLQALANAGFKIIVFSGRGNKDLETRLTKLGIDTYDYINDNPEERQDNPGKVVANFYIDDKAIEFVNWKEAIGKVMKHGDEADTADKDEHLDEVSEQVPEKAQKAPKVESGETVEKNGDFASDFKYSLIAGAMKLLDSCPKCKEMGNEEKIKILQDTINNINPYKEDIMTKEEIKKEDSPVAPAAPAPKDPIAELKEMIAMLVQKVGAIEAKVGNPAPVAAPAPIATADPMVKAEAPAEEKKEEMIEKAEPVKTLPVFQGQKKQEDKELGPDKVSGEQYLNKKDVEGIVEATVANVISRMGFTETPKAKEPVTHPLEKVDNVEKMSMGGLANMKYENINEIASIMMGGPRL